MSFITWHSGNGVAVDQEEEAVNNAGCTQSLNDPFGIIVLDCHCALNLVVR
jgi:hypothetical protein